MKYTLERICKEDRYLLFHRDGSSLTCPFYSHAATCGQWCPLFNVIDIGPVGPGLPLRKQVVRLHCGSGNAEYEIRP